MNVLKKIPISVALFLFFFSIYAAAMSGQIQYGDEIEKYRVAQSIVDRHEFSFRPTAMRNETGVAGRTYSIYELGQTLVEAPFYLLGRMAFAVFPAPDVNWITQLFVGWLNPLVTALTGVLVYLMCRTLGFRLNTSIALSVVFALGTIAAPYAKGFTREPLLGCLILLAVWALLRFEKTYRTGWLYVAGVAAGYLVFTKFIHAIIIPCLIVYLLVVLWERNKANRGGLRKFVRLGVTVLVIFLLPALVFVAAQSLYGVARFGTPVGGIAGTRLNPLEWILRVMQDARPVEAILGLLFSPAKSIFVYSPPLLLGAIAWFRWVRVQTKQALLVLALLVVELASVVTRPDWAGGTWWGPRYLVQIVPLLIIPIGALEDAPRLKRAFSSLVAVFGALGVIVQVVGLSASTRDYLDATAIGITFAGQLEFLRHGAIDSLLLYWSPVGFPLHINPYGIVLLAIIVLLGIAIAWQFVRGDSNSAWVRAGIPFAAIVLAIEFGAFLIWIVAPYPQVAAARGDTHYVAGNAFLADGKPDRAVAMYLLALDRGSNYQRDAAAQVEKLMPRVRGEPITASALMAELENPGDALVTEDKAVTLSGDGSLNISIPGEKDGTVSAMSDWITVEPNSMYELSGWIRTENVYGLGYGTVSWYEDNGVWAKSRRMDITSLDETAGWRPFRKTVTTLATTRRIMLSAGLWKTFGTVWIDGVELARIPNQ